MKQKISLLLLSGIVALFIASCMGTNEPKPVDVEAVKAEIQKMEDAYAAAEKAKDANAVVAYYSDDAVSYNRNEEPSAGKEAIKTRIASRMAKDTTGDAPAYKIIDLFAEGNQVVEIGSWTAVHPDGTSEMKGYYLSVFQKRDGKYVCIRDMNVSVKPEKAAMPM